MSFTNNYSIAHLYDLHLVKSIVSKQILAPSDKNRIFSWHLGDGLITVTTSFQHLRYIWEAGKLTPNTNDRVNTAMRTAYSLMGVGLHGCDGLDPPAPMCLTTAYLLPRLLHGLKAVILSAGQLAQLGQFFKKFIRQFQCLPLNIATPAVFLLMGTLPNQALLERKHLSFFGAITRLDQDNPLRQVAIRQLACKSLTLKSSFSGISNQGRK